MESPSNPSNPRPCRGSFLMQSHKTPLEMLRESLEFTLRYKSLTLFAIVIASHGIVPIPDVIALDFFSTPTLMILSILLALAWVYLSAGLYPLLWDRFQNGPNDWSRFQNDARDYFLPYLTTLIVLSIYLVVLLFLFLTPHCLLSPETFEKSRLFHAVVFGVFIFSLSTVYCIPLLFTQDLKNLACLKEGLRCLDRWRENSVLWGLVLLQNGVTFLLRHFLDRSSPSDPVYWFLAVMQGGINGYCLVLIFLTASQLLMRDWTNLRNGPGTNTRILS